MQCLSAAIFNTFFMFHSRQIASIDIRVTSFFLSELGRFGLPFFNVNVLQLYLTILHANMVY